MKKMGWLLFVICCLVGCKEEQFTAINQHQDFIASVNILEPSLSFFDAEGKALATWAFEQAYTGATLIQHDRVLLYGYDLSEAHVYELSSGEKLATIDCGIGVTNAYYDAKTEQFFMSNSKTNSITSYDIQAREKRQQKVANYPLSMLVAGGKLYVVNYKDTVLSILDSSTLEEIEEWPIEHSSHGLLIVDDELWVGGHGQGTQANATVDVYDLQTGQLKKEVAAPLMPVGFSMYEERVAVISHGESTLYEMNTAGEMLTEMKIGANPFAVQYFANQLVVAGYDDQKVYFVKDEIIQKEMATAAGPFQLLVRENAK